MSLNCRTTLSVLLAGLALAACSSGRAPSTSQPAISPPADLLASQPPGESYEQTLRFYRDLPYPRLEKLMDKYGGGVTSFWNCTVDGHRERVEPRLVDEDSFDTIIEFSTNTDLVPTCNQICKRTRLPNGAALMRSARITALGHLLFEETFLNNRKHGVSRGWYKRGQLAIASNFENDARHGLEFCYAPDGPLRQLAQWNHGKCLDAWTLIHGYWEHSIKDGNGWLTDYNWYFGDGEESGSMHFTNGLNDRSTG